MRPLLMSRGDPELEPLNMSARDSTINIFLCVIIIIIIIIIIVIILFMN